ncbi:MAG: hypothetical protein ACIAQF_06540, partial [Phycisphaerales bacterium JB065]
MQADIVVLAALEEEIEYAKSASGLHWVTKPSPPFSTRSYDFARTANGLVVAACHASQMGQIHAAVLTADVLRDLRPRLVVLLGI